jgi:hypothetical protein
MFSLVIKTPKKFSLVIGTSTQRKNTSHSEAIAAARLFPTTGSSGTFKVGTKFCSNKKCACHKAEHNTLILPCDVEWIRRISTKIKLLEYQAVYSSLRLASLMYHRVLTQGAPKYDMIQPRLFRTFELRAGHSSQNRLPKGGLLVLRWGGLPDVEKEEEGFVVYKDSSHTPWPVSKCQHVAINVDTNFLLYH